MVLVISHQNQAAVDTFSVFSNAMNKDIMNTIITPSDYVVVNKNYATVYLLHGAGGDHTNWISKVPELQRYADQYQIIIVCPDGDKTSWYFDSPNVANSVYETYISSELVVAIDDKYKTIASAKARAIAGLSMGGHGALFLAFRHQDVFGAAGSMSGGVDLRPFSDNWGIKDHLGSIEEHRQRWEDHSVINMTYLIKDSKLKLIIDCGVEDFFYDVNKNLHQKLLNEKIPHEFVVRPGNHNWEYWANAVQYQLLFFNEYFNSFREVQRK